MNDIQDDLTFEIIKWIPCSIIKFSMINKKMYNFFINNKKYILTNYFKQIDINVQYDVKLDVLKIINSDNQYKLFSKMVFYNYEIPYENDKEDFYGSYLDYASKKGHLPIIKIFIETKFYYCDIEELQIAFNFAVENNQKKTIDYFLNLNEELDTTDYLEKMIYSNDIQRMKKFTDNNIIYNDEEDTILEILLRKDTIKYLEIAKLVLSSLSRAHIGFYDDYTLQVHLDCVIKYGLIDITEYIILHNNIHNNIDNIDKLIKDAVDYEKLEILQLFVKLEFEIPSNYIIESTIYNNLEMVQFFLERDCEKKNILDAILYATEHNYTKISELLYKYK
jgi:hypothetical protein